MKRRQAAVFLDRDGVLIREVGYLSRIADMRVLSGVPEALKLLRKAGFKVVVTTNQSGVARGYFTLKTLKGLHAELKRRLAREGAKWDALYFAPQAADSGHPWRKPGIGMLLAARKRFCLDLKASYFVGDRFSDVQCARNAGCGAIVVRTGAGRSYKGPKPDAFRRDLLSAARWIIARSC